MITFFVFRRFGLAVPLSMLLVGFIIERIVDNKYGISYYSSHVLPLGLTIFVSGIIVTIISMIVESPSSSGSYTSLLVDFGDAVDDMKTDVQDKLETFIHENSEDDMFCYVPLNRCAQALMAVGIIVMIAGAFTD